MSDVIDLTGDDDEVRIAPPAAKRPRLAATEPASAGQGAEAVPASGNALLAELAAERRARMAARGDQGPAPSTAPATSSGRAATETAAKLAELRMLTYNLWFQEDCALRERMAAVGRIIEETKPHVVAFQEVTPRIESLLRQSSWWPHFTVSPSDIRCPYYTLLGVRKPPATRATEFTRMPFGNSAMGRDLLSTFLGMSLPDLRFVIALPISLPAVADAGDGSRVCVATSHLESFISPKQTSSSERVAQVRIATTALQQTYKHDDIVYAGDFNWDDGSVIEGVLQRQLPSDWIDCWAHLHGEKGGFTWDGPANPMLTSGMRKRLDRIVVRLRTFEVATVEMVGRDAIPGVLHRRVFRGTEKMVPVAPSDHFGLLMTLRRKASTTSC